MRRIITLSLLALAFIAVFSSRAAATEVGYSKKFGLGLMLGEPTGLTGKYWVALRNAVDFGVGFGFAGRYRDCDRHGNCWYGSYGDTISVNADYLWHPSVLARGQVELDWHVGVGGRIWFLDYNDRYESHGGFTNIGVRAPIGLDLMFNTPNFLEIYAEITPSFMFYWEGLIFDAGLGIRFYF